MPTHAVRRRPAAPAVLLTVAAAALGGLALLPARTAVAPAVPASRAAAESMPVEAERAAVLGRPPVRRTTVVTAATPKPVARPRPAAPRAARSRVRLVPAPPPLPVTGYACPIGGRTSFTDSWGDPRPGGRRHQGTDLLAAYGTPAVAVISGVVQTTYSASGGISLYLRGSDGNLYYYLHNSRNVAVTGQRVATGQLIAYVGNSGNASGGVSHVHFERHPGGGAAVNPYPFLRRLC